MDIQTLKNQLTEAIDQHYEVEILFQQDQQYRVVRPYYFGINGTTEQLHAYQVSGPSKSAKPLGWKNFTLASIKEIKITGNKFIPPDPQYNPKSRYKRVDYQIHYPDNPLLK